jgi:hypothetical protein
LATVEELLDSTIHFQFKRNPPVAKINYVLGPQWGILDTFCVSVFPTTNKPQHQGEDRNRFHFFFPKMDRMNNMQMFINAHPMKTTKATHLFRVSITSSWLS